MGAVPEAAATWRLLGAEEAEGHEQHLLTRCPTPCAHALHSVGRWCSPGPVSREKLRSWPGCATISKQSHTELPLCIRLCSRSLRPDQAHNCSFCPCMSARQLPGSGWACSPHPNLQPSLPRPLGPLPAPQPKSSAALQRWGGKESRMGPRTSPLGPQVGPKLTAFLSARSPHPASALFSP